MAPLNDKRIRPWAGRKMQLLVQKSAMTTCLGLCSICSVYSSFNAKGNVIPIFIGWRIRVKVIGWREDSKYSIPLIERCSHSQV